MVMVEENHNSHDVCSQAIYFTVLVHCLYHSHRISTYQKHLENMYILLTMSHLISSLFVQFVKIIAILLSAYFHFVLLTVVNIHAVQRGWPLDLAYET